MVKHFPSIHKRPRIFLSIFDVISIPQETEKMIEEEGKAQRFRRKQVKSHGRTGVGRSSFFEVDVLFESRKAKGAILRNISDLLNVNNNSFLSGRRGECHRPGA